VDKETQAEVFHQPNRMRPAAERISVMNTIAETTPTALNVFSHVSEDDTQYEQGGLRDFFLYRDLGIAAATGGQVVAQLVKANNGELFFRRIGITFAVYGDEESTERLIPFDIIPRVLTKPEWTKLEAGLRQRVTALNMFLADVYGPKECLKAGIIPPDLVYRNACYQLEMVDFQVPHGIYCHIAGIDIVRGRCRHLLCAGGQCAHPVRRLLHDGEPRGDAAALPRAVRHASRRAGRQYPDQLLATLRSVAPRSAPSTDRSAC
jgi:uncharacterized circularly permuted ATP-grasp superfamily protein